MQNTNEQKNEWSKRDIGALWKREGQNQKYLSGYVKIDELGIEREVKIVVFSNKNKNNNEKAPDYRIYVSKPLETAAKQQVSTKQQVAATTNVTQAKTKKQVAPQFEKEVVDNEEDVL